jgi:hypothetical protein
VKCFYCKRPLKVDRSKERGPNEVIRIRKCANKKCPNYVDRGPSIEIPLVRYEGLLEEREEMLKKMWAYDLVFSAALRVYDQQREQSKTPPQKDTGSTPGGKTSHP